MISLPTVRKTLSNSFYTLQPFLQHHVCGVFFSIIISCTWIKAYFEPRASAILPRLLIEAVHNDLSGPCLVRHRYWFLNRNLEPEPSSEFKSRDQKHVVQFCRPFLAIKIDSASVNRFA